MCLKKIKREEEAIEQQYYNPDKGQGVDKHRERAREMTLTIVAEAGFDRGQPERRMLGIIKSE